MRGCGGELSLQPAAANKNAVATAIREKPDADTGTLIKASLKELAP